MTSDEVLALFLEKVSGEYPKHMLHFFAASACRGVSLPFTTGMLRALATVERASPGYAGAQLDRIGRIRGVGESQYEAIIEILAEVYVTAAIASRADDLDGTAKFAREPGPRGKKNPEFEVCVSGHWCAVEVKTPRLLEHARQRSARPWQMLARVSREAPRDMHTTRPRDNPVKDFLLSADAKFAVYDTHRCHANRILVIVWDDYCHEAVAALASPASGLLTPQSFHRTEHGTAVIYPHIDAVLIVRHQHQIIRATRCEPLVDGLSNAFCYHHTGFPPKALVTAHGGRLIPQPIMGALGATPLGDCLGAEYGPGEMVMWTDAGSEPTTTGDS